MSALEKPQESFAPEQEEEASLAPSAPLEAPAPAPSKPRIFEITNPREDIRLRLEEQHLRLKLLDVWEEPALEVIRLARRTLPVQLPVMVDIQPQVMRYHWLTPPLQQRVRVKIDVKETTGWDAVAPFLEACEDLGFPLEKWQSIDDPRDNRRQYNVCTPDETFGILLYCYLKEEVDEEAAKATCRRVLVGKKIHYGHTWEEEVYAFDCGQGAEATIRAALEKGALK